VGNCHFCGGDVAAELALKQSILYNGGSIVTKLGNVADWAYPFFGDDCATAAMKKAARVIKQMDVDKSWCISDVEETLELLKAALEAKEQTNEH